MFNKVIETLEMLPPIYLFQGFPLAPSSAFEFALSFKIDY